MNQVFVCGSYFHVYSSILKTLLAKNKNHKTLLILNDHIPDTTMVLSNLKASCIFDYVISAPIRKIEQRIKKENSFFKRILNRNALSIKYVDYYLNIKEYHEFIRNAEINLFYTSGLTSAYFVLKYPSNFIRLVEDGERNYNPHISRTKAWKRKYLLNTMMGEGLDDEIKEIEVQHPERLPSRVKHKGKRLDLKSMRDLLNAEDVDKIIGIFFNSREPINLQGDRKLILITQPLSEEGYLSEERKIELYNKVLEPYHEFIIFIKPHPREVTVYTDKLKVKFTEIFRDFPLELMELLNEEQFDIGVTLYSSAINNMDCINKKIILGKEYMTGFF